MPKMSEEGERDIEAGPAGDGEPFNDFETTRGKLKSSTLKDKIRAISKTLNSVNNSMAMDKSSTSNSSPCESLIGIVGLCVAGVVCVACLGFLLVTQLLPLITLVIGVMYRDQEKYCPAGPIPLLLIIRGSIQLAQWFFGLFTESANKKQNADPALGNGANSTQPKQTPPNPGTCAIVVHYINRILRYASYASFFTCCIFVYRLYSHVRYEESSPMEDYCHQVLYLFAFWLLTSSFIGWSLLFIVFIIMKSVSAWLRRP